MNVGDSLRILGVGPDSSPQQIRQAYQDLVRVWHPDRFQSDARLQQIAQEHLREINQAYAELKDYRPPAPPRPAPPAPTAETTQPTAQVPPRPTYAPPRPSPRFRPRTRWPVRLPGAAPRAALVALLCAAPFLAAVQLVRLLRVPVMDANLIAARTLRPDVLAPMRIIDPSTDVRAAADMMTQWASGDALDLWKPTPASLQAHFRRAPGSMPEAPSQPTGELRKSQERRPRVTARPLPAPPEQPHLASGSELIHAGRSSGAGYLRLSNHTNLEAIVKVVGNRSTLRAIYIRPNENAILRSVKVGVYDLHVELGTDLDIERLQFRKNRYTPDPLGPFEFLEITSENGISGSHYDVALKPR
jgi:hypothetical protein